MPAAALISIAKLLYENQQYAQAAEIFALNETSGKPTLLF